ncbi:MAG: FkbM family methyltransferase [Betaproteobacteria bacterium]|nr:FkbM family methyltransferase [Betaproteobacteria bacterium]MBI2959253.1 FkbM family methyltransferase [Betaproteobacteria bacterium]
MKTFTKECRWGTFLLLKGDLISVYADMYGEWSEMEVKLFRKILTPQSNVVEIGANLGLHTVPLAKTAAKGSVICFEPQRILFQMLCANAAINDLTNVFAYRAAVSDSGRETRIQSSDYETPWNYGSFSIETGMSAEGRFPGDVTMESVKVVSLDAFTPANELASLNLLKIDAELHEIAVLRGAERLIKRHRPVIFVENNKEQNGDALIEAVKDLGYSPFWFCSKRFQPDNFNKVGFELPGADTNMVCFPEGENPVRGLAPAKHFSELAEGKVPLVAHIA